MIREATINDAKELAELINYVENNSEFLLYEPGERKLTEKKQRQMIESFATQSNATIFLAEKQDNLVGYVLLIGGKSKRTRHAAYLVIGIHPDYRGQRIGTELFAHLEKWANGNAIHRLELTVVCENAAGVALYKKYGFEVEGIKRDSLFIGGTYYDEYYMAKLL